MNLKYLQLLIAGTLVLAISTTIAAQTEKIESLSVRLGNKTILIPPPEGLQEALETYEIIKAHFKPAEPPESDLLAVYVPHADIELMKRGERPLMHHYTKVSVIRETREQDVSKSFFAEVVGLIRKEGATLIDPNAPETKKLIENFEQELTKLKSTSTNLEVGKPTILGIYDVRPNAESTLLTMAIKLQAGTESVNRLLVVGASIIHVKDRMLFVNSYRTYQSRTDLQTMKDSTTRWIDSIFAANEVRPTPPNPK